MIAVRSKSNALFGAAALCAILACLAFTDDASAAKAWWQLNAVSVPAKLPPGGHGELIVSAANLGDAEVSGAATPIVLRDTLPTGISATGVTGTVGGWGAVMHNLGPVECSLASPQVVECTFKGSLPSYDQLEVQISVSAQSNPVGTNEATIFGGESDICQPVSALSGKFANGTCEGEGTGGFEKQLSGEAIRTASARRELAVGSEATPFGIEDYEMTAVNEDGSIDTQAGSHPFALTTTVAFNRTGTDPYQPGLPKDLRFKLPPGLIGNPTPFPQCSDAQFSAKHTYINDCPPDTALGVASIAVGDAASFGRTTMPVPLFNLEPNAGEPARFGFFVLGVPVTLDTSVRTGGDYGVTVTVPNIPELVPLLASQVTFWGVPGDPSHDQSRGWECLAGGAWAAADEGVPPCAAVGHSQAPPFLALPTSCTGTLQAPMEVDSWEQKGSFLPQLEPTFEPALDGCNRLLFSPTISVAPDGPSGSTPSGLTVGIHVPQDVSLDPSGLSEADVKSTTVTLPAGVALNPAAADGLESCAETQVALEVDSPPSCPEAAKVGTVTIRTPLLPNALEGAVYLAAQDENPFGSLVALYLVAQDPISGTLIKVAGEVRPDPVTGQLVSSFNDTPQLPFEDLSLHFFGGDRAPLASPALCGTYTTSTSIEGWSGNPASTPSSSFQITSGPNGSPCSSPQPFAPLLTAGTTSIQAGGFSPFTMTMSREDGQQSLQAVQLKMPPGLLGTLATVKLCGEAQANAGTCGGESEIGETIVSVGVGGDPFSVRGGKVFITGPYEGAPYGLSIVNPAKAGPFDLGQVIVRAKIEVDPTTAALTITTDSTGAYRIPTILDGIPLQIRHVNVTINRPGFTFNPTDCSPLAVTGKLSSSEGSQRALSVPFQVTNCAVLAFKPKLTARTAGKTSRKIGASLSVKLTYPAGPYDANIAKVKVDLPKQLPSKLPTLQQACPAATFEANPASCPPASIVGHARATTPVLPVPLTGPAYFVSHGGEAFPDLVIVLQGYGATVHLVGSTYINPKTNVTSSTFKNVPDVPVGTFELTLPQGKYSALAATANLCTTKLTMPTAFIGQNGAEIHTTTPIAPTGCPKHKSTKAGKAKTNKSKTAKKR